MYSPAKNITTGMKAYCVDTGTIGVIHYITDLLNNKFHKLKYSQVHRVCIDDGNKQVYIDKNNVRFP